MLALALLVGAGLPVAPAAAAAASCTTSDSPSGYSITVCLDEPAQGSSLSGDARVSASLTKSSGAPSTTKLYFYVDGRYALADFESPYSFELPTRRWVDGDHLIEVEAVMSDGFVSRRAGATATFSNGVTEPPSNTDTFTPTAPSKPGEPLVVGATGDGAGGRSRSKDVSDLVESWNPDMFLYLGDVYEKGSASEFHNWYGTEDRLFGRFKDVTNPTVGNHEYQIPNAADYFDYWDNAPNYYGYEANGWKLLSLDSTSDFDQTAPGTPQYEWLREQLETNTSDCTLAYFHHPVYSVGRYAAETRMTPIWDLLAQHGVDLVLTGHDHNYQRWKPMGQGGALDPNGITHFIAGAGGHSVYPFTRTDDRLAAGVDTSPAAYGALRLELNEDGAGYRYVNTSGATPDSGAIECSGAPEDVVAPTAPSGLSATAVARNEVALSWTASRDNTGVHAYEIYRDGVLLATSGSQTTYTDTSAAAGTTYQYEVRALDPAGNRSEPSNSASATTPTTLFVDDFESGDLVKWTKVNGVTVGQQEVFGGSYAARATSTGGVAYAMKHLSSPQSEVFYRLRFKIVSRPSSTYAYLLKLRTPSEAAIAGVFVNPSGYLTLRNDVLGTNTISNQPVTTGAWHELQVRLVTGAGGQSEVWYDGARVDSLSKTESFGSNAVGRVHMGDNGSGRSFDIAFDDIVLDTRFIDSPPPPDTSPPSSPTSVAANASSHDRVDLTWSASTDDRGVTGYDVFRDGTLLASIGPDTSYSDTTVAPEQTYAYQVRARDAAGNESALSEPASATTPPAPSQIFYDGFESGDMSRWNTARGVTVGQQEVFAGSYGARATSNGGVAYAMKQLPQPEDELYYRVRFKLINRGGSYVYLVKHRTATGGAIGGVFVSAGGYLALRNDVLATSTISKKAVTSGVWHELQVRLLTGSSGSSEVWFDGVRIDALSKTESFGTSNIGRVHLGDNVSGRNFDVAFDDVELDTEFIDTPAEPDTTAPSAPTGLSAEATSAYNVELAWTAATDNRGVTGYDVYRDGALLATTGPETTYSDASVAPERTYVYEVVARDDAGNVSAPSNSATATTPSAPATIFEDGFETGDMSRWSFATGIRAQSDHVYAGSFGARATSTGEATYANKRLGTGYNELHYRMRFKLISRGSRYVYLMRFRTGTGGLISGLFINSNGYLAYRNDVAGVSKASVVSIAPGRWYDVQVRVKIGGSASVSEVWLDGSKLARLSGTETLGSTPVGRLQLGEAGTGGTYDIAYDEVKAAESFISGP